MLDLKPIYNTGTISFSDTPTVVENKNFKRDKAIDANEIIPHGIYRVFNNEIKKQKFIIGLNLVIFLSFLITIILMAASVIKTLGWFWYIPFSIFVLCAGWKSVSTNLELSGMKASIRSYREALSNGSSFTPLFITKMYMKLYQTQVAQNWVTIAILFYGSLGVIVFWFLKDAKPFWIFDFKTWIDNSTKNPELVAYFLIFGLILTGILYFAFTIYRKKRVIDIQSFFGNEVVSQVEIETIKSKKNKLYGKIFFFSVLIILLLPIVGWIIYKLIKKK